MRIQAGFGLLLLLVVSSASAEPKAPPADETMRDARDYLGAISQAKELSIDDQIEFWRHFLNDHPQTSFRSEIEANKKRLDEFLMETDPTRKREQKDSDRYLRAVEIAKKLSEEDQIDLWGQYLDENPRSLYRKEILQKLEGLTAKQGKSGVARPSTTPPRPGLRESGPVSIAPRLETKDPSTAILLGTFPGLLVPGIAHWYTRDYTLAGVLTGARVGGLAIGIPGIIRNNPTMIIAGAIVAGFTYLVDVADAPFTVQRYNDDLETKAKAESRSESEVFPLGFSVSFNF
jgi:hypothetical protein